MSYRHILKRNINTSDTNKILKDLNNINFHIKKNKNGIKIVYLGGFYMAEHSMLQSFIENNSEIIFPIDTNEYGRDYFNNIFMNNHTQHKYVFSINSGNLEIFLDRYNPDVVIHRHYMGDPVMHINSYEICQKLKIPFIRYEMETDINDDRSCDGDDFDIFLYAHDTEYFKRSVSKMKKPSYFYHYGVSGIEKRLKTKKTRNIGALGYYRSIIKEREKNLIMYVDQLKKSNEKINVYGNEGEWELFPKKDHIIINDQFSLEDTTKILNKHKIIINFESLSDLEGAYTHKIFQSLGCGIPTITKYKKCLENMFGDTNDNIIMIKEPDEINYWVTKLLKDDKLREKISRNSYNYIHKNFDWYKMIYKILKKSEII